MVHRALSDKAYLLLGLLSPLNTSLHFGNVIFFFKIWNKFNMIQIPRKMEPIFSKENPGNRVLRKIVAYVFLTVPWVKVQNFQNPELMKFIFYNLQYLYLQNINISSLNGLLSLDKL